MKSLSTLTCFAVLLFCSLSAGALAPEAALAPSVEAAAPAANVLVQQALDVEAPAAACSALSSTLSGTFEDALFGSCDPQVCSSLCLAKGFRAGFCILGTCVCEMYPYPRAPER